MDLETFSRNIRKISGNRNHKIRDSVDLRDIHTFIRKNKWFDIERPLKEKEFSSIIKEVNLLIAEEIIKGNDINFPYHMGRLELRKFETKVEFREGVLYTNKPIDWDTTIKLWYEDEESYNNKTLVRRDSKEIFKVFYNRIVAKFTNKSYYKFIPCRALKKKLKSAIYLNKTDALLLR